MLQILKVCGDSEPGRNRGCGAAFLTTQPNAKLCHTCRLLAELKWLGERGSRGRVRDCKACGRPFARLKASDSLCSDCDDVRKWRPGLCELCSSDAQLIADDVHLCLRCAKDPDAAAQLHLLQWLTGQRGVRRQDPLRAAEIDAWRIASVAASRAGEKLPPRPARAAPPLLTPGSESVLDGEDLSPAYHATLDAEGWASWDPEDWESAVLTAAQDRWGGLVDADGNDLYMLLSDAIGEESRPEVRAWLAAHVELRDRVLSGEDTTAWGARLGTA